MNSLTCLKRPALSKQVPFRDYPRLYTIPLDGLAIDLHASCPLKVPAGKENKIRYFQQPKL